MTNSTSLQHHDATSLKPHVVAFPSFPFGHLQPMMLLCEALAASSNDAITITFVHTPLKLQMVRDLQPRNPSIRTVYLSGEMPEGNFSSRKQILEAFETKAGLELEQLILDFNRSGCPVTCFISDVIWAWPFVLAKKLKIPLIAGFTPFCLAALYVNHHMPYLLATGQLLANGSPTASTFCIEPVFPRLPSARRQWRPEVPDEEGEKLAVEITLGALEEAKHLRWILCNTCYDWESRVIDALSKELAILPIGPLFLAAEKARDKIPNSSTTPPSQEGKECLEWLDKQAASSVIYISFGSITALNRAQIEELSLGVEACGLPFLWVLPRLSDPQNGNATPDPFPKGFVERTSSRAHFVGWAPQSLVLKHSSIGCYMCHSGWNSVAESICLGVPMLAMSFLGDQRMNYLYLVEEWGVAKALRSKDEENGKLCRHDVEKAIRCVMSDCEEGKQIKTRVRKLKDAAMAAVEDGGFSSNNLHAFIQDIFKHS